MAFKFQPFDLHYAPELSSIWTKTLPLGVALVVLVSLVVLRYRSTIKDGAEQMKVKSQAVALTNDMNSWRLKENNFGYKDVRVSKLLIHPIKSCKGTSLQSCRYTPQGLEYDRNWAVIDAKTHATITARDHGKMVLIKPTVIPEQGILHVSFPENSGCESFTVPLNPTEDVLKNWKPVDNMSMWGVYTLDGYICETLPPSTLSISDTLSKYIGRSVHLVYKGNKPRVCATTPAFPNLDASFKFQDGYPFLFFSQENTTAIQEAVRKRIGEQGIQEKWKTEKVVVERFRPNIVLSGAGPFAEDNWKEISLGPDMASAERAPPIFLVSKCTRCLLPNVEPETGIRDAAVPYKVMMKFRLVDPLDKWKPCAGCNGVPTSEGIIRVGDFVCVKQLVDSQ